MKPHKKDKLKLKPTLKEKRHYLIIELISQEKLNDQDIKNKIESSIRHFIGSLGLACSGPIFVKIQEMQVKRNKSSLILSSNEVKSNKKTDIKYKNLSINYNLYSAPNENLMNVNDGSIDKTSKYRYLIIFSVLTKYVDYAKASLILFEDKNVSMKCIGVSGTIKKSERFFK